LTITDNDLGGELNFSASTYTVRESGLRATITVKRTGGTASGVTVDYSTSNGTAAAGVDYTATAGTLVFLSGQTSKTFTIPILNDTIFEGDETINLTLANATGGATLGPQNTAVLTITDNDFGGAFRFSGSAYTVSEAGPVATITISRSGGTASGVTVDYVTSDGTATAGVDYTAVSGTLLFAAGQISQTFTVPVTNDAIDEPNKTVNLGLSNPTGGATLGTPVAAILTITDNDL
jgi:hypothetical protein